MTPVSTENLHQNPVPGTRLLRFAGDLQRFSLEMTAAASGTAWLRTNIGWSRIGRREIVDAVEADKALLGQDWFDIPMLQTGENRFEISLPLAQVGHFEAKCYFQPADTDTPLWPGGENVTINVEPAETVCSNTIYNAFVRQFGPNKNQRENLSEPDRRVIRRLDEAGFAVIPPSGTFRDLIAELDFILGTLGCRYIQLLPINPTPTTYGRMGRFGSPYAALSFTAVDPALARFDPSATPLEQFTELVDAVHLRGGRLLLDLAINHTGWAAALHGTHPAWLRRDPAGRIENPGAWGVTWADLTELDYRHRGLWRYMAEVFLTWCHRGVDGFRCDAGYMIPLPAWKYIIARVREQYRDTVFFLEGLGGKISVTRELLNSGNFNWAYSELFQNYDRGSVEQYLPGALDISRSDGIAVHFCETHDNNRLAATSLRFSRMRTALCALASVCGGFAFANGVEWFATEKIDVHGSPSLNWGAEPNQVEDIRRLTGLLHRHPAFYDRTRIEMIQEGEGNFLVLQRHHKPTGRRLTVLVNLDPESPVEACWNASRAPAGTEHLVDLLSGRPVSVIQDGGRHRLALGPGQVMCLSDRRQDLDTIRDGDEPGPFFPGRLRRQRLQAKALEVLEHLRGTAHLDATELEKAADRLAADPVDFCRTVASGGSESPIVFWRWPADARREVMVPPGFFLLITADAPFRVRVMQKQRCLASEDSLRQQDGPYFALLCPLSINDRRCRLALHLSVYETTGPVHGQSRLLFLAPFGNASVQSVFRRPELLAGERLCLETNGLGGMLRAPVSWGRLKSRYDALLAANLNPDAPDDRRVLLTRCRIWSVFQGTSQQIGDDCLDAFTAAGSRSVWRFRLPTGQGQHIVVRLGLEMVAEKNAIRLLLFREPAGDDPHRLPDEKPVRLIVRPDIEDRSFHEVTKAYAGLEDQFPASVRPVENGFDFQPAPDRALSLRASGAAFTWEPEWYYMVHRPLEAQRGLDPDSDLFSPGYLEGRVSGGESLEITAAAGGRPEPEPFAPGDLHTGVASAFSGPDTLELPAVLQRALTHYVVRRRALSTVIAGYPWFLDWGRDTLIFVRGLIAAGRHDTAARILKQFAAFEEKGTLPNMIRGEDAGNRDTSDAPLWFFTACADLCRAQASRSFLDTRIGQRTVGGILADMARSMIGGTPNGIRVDPDSGLLFSPAHFTWMDTNHPAGTPREGYPVEIQALWWAALDFLARIDPEAPANGWPALARRVRQAVAELYGQAPGVGLRDCLHGSPGTPARRASADDALRPNQLFALTLGAISDAVLGRRVLDACAELLVPGAIRSLADRPVLHRLEIVYRGELRVDPHRPYQGKYFGDEDTQRKPAYHNGTAWTWVFPSFCEAWAMMYPDTGRQTALSYLGSCVELLATGCVGHLPEILDGDFPHSARGCDAQAWGASEYFRVWKKLSGA